MGLARKAGDDSSHLCIFKYNPRHGRFHPWPDHEFWRFQANSRKHLLPDFFHVLPKKVMAVLISYAHGVNPGYLLENSLAL